MRNRVPPLQIAALAALVAAVAWAYGPLLVEFSTNTWRNKPHYQHFPFIVLGAVLLFVARLQGDASGRPPGQVWAPIGGAAAWLLLVPAHLVVSPLFAAASFILLLGAAGCLVCRALDRPFPLGAWSLLWLVLPPPVGLDGRLIQGLQRQSSWLASQTLDVLGINHLMDGNALVLADKTLFVDEACSGVVSAVSIVSCAALYGVWRSRGLAHTLLLMAAAAGWAMLLNVVRIVAIALAHELAGWDWAEGLSHTAVGLSAFGLGLLTLVTTDWLLMALLAEVGPRWDSLTAEPIRFGHWLVDLWDDWLATPETPEDGALEAPSRLPWARLLTGTVGVTVALVTTVAFAAVGGLNLTRAYEQHATVDFPQAAAVAESLQLKGVMPEEVAGLRLVSVEHQQRSEESLFAQHSVIYLYQSGDGDQYLLSCDFPYVGGWHELSVCYRGIGWRLEDRQVTSTRPVSPGAVSPGAGGPSSGPSGDFDIAQLDLTKPDGRSALVMFCGCFLDGAPVPAPAMTLQESLLNALTGNRQRNDARHSFQVQVLTERSVLISEADREASLQLISVALGRFAEVVMQQPR